MTHPESKSPPSRSAGFSLIELLVVIGIIAVAAAIALPAIGRYIRLYRIRGATQQVAGEIQAARNRAINKNVNQGVVFLTLGPTTYQWAVEDDQTGTGAGRTSARPTITASFLADKAQASPVYSLPSGITFANALAGCPSPAPTGGAFDTGMRFNRLGMWCDPGSSSTTCPNIGFGQSLVYNIPPTAANPGSTLCLNEVSTGLKRTVTVLQGGRVQAQP